MMKRLLVFVVSILATSISSHAATRIELLPSSQQIASGAGPCLNVPTVISADVYVVVSAQSGTTPTLDVWLERCQDSAATNVAELLAAWAFKSTTTGSNPTIATNVRDVVDNAGATTGTWTAHYPELNARWVRIRWAMGGTTPTYTFSVVLDGK